MTKTEAIRVRLDKDELDKLDDYCDRNKMSRSMAIRLSIVYYMENVDRQRSELFWQSLAKAVIEESNEHKDAA